MTIRLNSHHRSLLKKHAKEIVMNDTTGLEQITQMKNDLGFAALNFLKKEYPESDMLILKKYDRAEKVGGFTFIALETSDVINISLRDEAGNKVEILTPVNASYRAGFRATKEMTDLYYKYGVEKNKFNARLNEKLNKYFQVIDHFKTYEKLVEAWPEAAQISNEFTDNLPAAISDDTIAMVKAEAEKRMAAKK